MKNIIIISKFFAPANSIASIRWTKIVKYLDRTGKYNITVIAWKMDDNDVIDSTLYADIKKFSHRVNIIYIDHIYDTSSTKLVNLYHGHLKKSSKIEEHKMLAYIPYTSASLSQKVKLTMKYERFLSHEKRYVRLALAEVNRILDNTHVMISSYGDFGDLLLALEIKKRKPDIKFIADYRDPVIRYFWPPMLVPFAKKMVADVSKAADVIIGVTKECIDAHAFPQKNFIIPNGFDTEDKAQISSRVRKDKRLHICLTGTVYVERRDHFHILYKALTQLHEEKKIDINNIVIDYAGRYSWYVTEQAKKKGTESIIEDHGFVSREKALWLQDQADILLVLSCNNEGESGVLTGKFLEYMMMEKKILALISGNKPDSIIKCIIEEGNLGFCYEEASRSTDYGRLCGFLKEAYAEHKNTGQVKAEPRKEVIDRYNYYNIAKEFEKFI